jgi:hypothetical protein
MSISDVHEWIHDAMRLTEADVVMVNVDGTKRQVFVKLREFNKMQEILTSTRGSVEVRHMNGEISTVRIEAAEWGTKRVRLENLPLEVPDSAIITTMSRFGYVREVLAEKWSAKYRYQVFNENRIVMITLLKHVPLTIVVAGHRALVSYEGQPATCYRCAETGHVYQDCPRRRRGREVAGADSFEGERLPTGALETSLGEKDATSGAAIEKVVNTLDTGHDEGGVNKANIR